MDHRRIFAHTTGCNEAKQSRRDPNNRRYNLEHENCSGCAIRGRGRHSMCRDDNGYRQPNYAGWALVYIEAKRRVPPIFLAAFDAVRRREDAHGKRVAARIQETGYNPRSW